MDLAIFLQHDSSLSRATRSITGEVNRTSWIEVERPRLTPQDVHSKPPSPHHQTSLTNPQARHPEDHFRLRLHRARSVVLTPTELVEIRAAQRTFEGAYMRTSLSQFSFALIILKIFTSEFYSIGALFAVYGAGVLLVSAYRRQQGNKQFFTEVGDEGLGRKKFRTSGNVVVVLTALSVAAYVSLLVLTLRLD
jgi:hypothetical protein